MKENNPVVTLVGFIFIQCLILAGVFLIKDALSVDLSFKDMFELSVAFTLFVSVIKLWLFPFN